MARTPRNPFDPVGAGGGLTENDFTTGVSASGYSIIGQAFGGKKNHLGKVKNSSAQEPYVSELFKRHNTYAY